MEVLPVYKTSFFTSTQREDGARLTILYEDGVVFCDLLVDERFDAGEGTIYGGLLFGVMDSLIWYVILMEERKVAVTRKVDVEFFEPVQCGRQYRAKSKIVGMEERDIRATAWIEDEYGAVCTQVKAIFRESKSISINDIVGQFDFTNTSSTIRNFFKVPEEERF